MIIADDFSSPYFFQRATKMFSISKYAMNCGGEFAKLEN